MSQRIDDLLSILAEIHQDFSSLDHSSDQIQRLRNAAEKRIAQTRRVVQTTVKDSYTRKLGQGGAAILDTRIGAWLRGQSFELRQLALSLASGQKDEIKIQAFFSSEGRDSGQAKTPESPPVPAVGSASGAGFGDAENNAEVEQAAIQAVTDAYDKEGWRVRSVEHERCGFDLECRRLEEKEDVEVKGVSGSQQNFVITAGEVQQARTNPRFVLVVVTQARTTIPQLHRYSGREFWQQFSLTPIQYRSTLSQGEE